jgi:hypothetical protein
MNLTSILAIPWVVPIVCGCTVAIVAILAGVISDVVKNVAHTNLKRAMVDQGYTIDQIDHVLTSSEATNHADKVKAPVKGHA